MIQRYGDIAEKNITSFSYKKGKKQYLTLKVWIDKKPKRFFVLCPFCNSPHIQYDMLRKVYESFVSAKKVDKMFVKCIKCDKKFLIEDLIIGKPIRTKGVTMRKFQLFIKSYNDRPDFESEIITALTRHEAGKKFKARFFSGDFDWDLEKVVNHVVDMTDFIESNK